ncbi:hypothetical protein AGRA671_19320 [Agrobacterium radiobacter]
MLLQAELCGGNDAAENGQQPSFTIAMPAPIDGNCFEAEVNGGQMRAGGDAGLAQE